MKEQVITPRAGRSGAGARGRSGDIVQRPARRDRAQSARAHKDGLRKVLAYVPVVAKVVLAVLAGVLVFAGYRAAASASFFQVRAVDVSQTSKVSADEIRTIVRRAVAPVGVWRVDLDKLSAELERLPWVRRAVVSRVLPDGLRVRIVERTPRAIVRTSQGRLVWVDDDAVALGELQPTDQLPQFFIRGWDEDQTDVARAGNRERVERYLVMLREWEKLRLTERISEVNLIDLNDVRVQLAADDSQIEVRIGRENFGPRLQKALQKLDEERSTPVGPFITYIDASMWMKSGDKVVLGTNPNAPNFNTNKENATSDDTEIVRQNARSLASEKKVERDKKKTEDNARSRTGETKKDGDKKKDQDKRERAADDAKRQSRPRRVS